MKRVVRFSISTASGPGGLVKLKRVRRSLRQAPLRARRPAHSPPVRSGQGLRVSVCVCGALLALWVWHGFCCSSFAVLEQGTCAKPTPTLWHSGGRLLFLSVFRFASLASGASWSITLSRG
uniref:Uncharacterized protein n=1 Tax=Trypanosoma congolense (strain IL3000) TaxID=1068625 RepID=G0V0P4_TRYCI|nr:hypothetical protein, unlikely [Trypanosoma congolense IL3000]